MLFYITRTRLTYLNDEGEGRCPPLSPLYHCLFCYENIHWKPFDEPYRAYIIDIINIDNLLEISKEYPIIIHNKYDEKDELPTIEIYNELRE